MALFVLVLLFILFTSFTVVATKKNKFNEVAVTTAEKANENKIRASIVCRVRDDQKSNLVFELENLFHQGKVQGVFYRAYATQHATSLGLVGYVRNVEVCTNFLLCFS